MWRKLLAGLSLILILVPTVATAQSITVTRKGSNLYKVDGQETWIRTRYCYEYAYSEEVAVTRSSMFFMDSDEKCDVKQVLSEVQLKAGTYKIRVTHDDDNLYSTMEGLVIRTSMCLELGISEEAILHVGAFGTGSLIFLDNERKCTVDGLLTE